MHRPRPANLLTIRNICAKASAGAAKGVAQSDLCCSAYSLLQVFQIEMISWWYLLTKTFLKAAALMDETLLLLFTFKFIYLLTP